MIRQILSLIICILLGLTATGQDLISRTLDNLSCQSTEEPNEISKKLDNSKRSNPIELFVWDDRKSENDMDLVQLKINRSFMEKMRGSLEQTSIEIPVSKDKSFFIDLYPVKIQSEGGRLLTQKGSQKSSNKMLFYRGNIRGDHGSIASVAIINDDVHINLYDQDGVYRVNPSGFKSNNYAIWSDQSIEELSYTCGSSGKYKQGTTTAHYPIKEVKEEGSNQKALDDVVEVYVECDKELFDDKGGTMGVETFVALLFAEVSALYANENINLMVSDIFVWSVNDPYRGNSNLGTVLPLFGSNIRNNYDGRIATLLKGNTTNSCSISGLAWVDVLCNTYSSGQMSGPYNVNQGVGFCTLNPNPTTLFQALDVSLVAHEIGHNMASPHTHGCCWGPNLNQAIDDCPGFNQNCTNGASQSCSNVSNQSPDEIGTIMSYCNNSDVFTKGFGTEPGNLMRNRVAAATCLAEGAPDCTENNIVYSNVTLGNTTEYSNRDITLNNTVTISNNSTIFWQAENELLVNGTFTVPSTSTLEMVRDDCN